MRTPHQTLKAIEYQKRTWRSEFMRTHEIWMAIAMQLNSSTTKEDKKFWGKVMDLYHKKYRTEKPKG